MTAEGTWQLKLLAPRYAYLPALAEQCLTFFQHVLLSLPGQAAPAPWLEHQGLPLNWTQPLGVLHDLLTPSLSQAAAGSSSQQQQQQQQQACILSAAAGPWCLTVHYRNMPASLSNSWQNAGTAKDYFFSSLKEAGYCCRGSDGAAAVMRLPGQAQDELWAAVNRADAAAARRITAPLRLHPTARQPAATATVPVRLFIRQHTAGSSEDLAAVWEQVFSSSRPVEALQPDGSPTLLAHLVHAVLPRQFPAPVPPAAGAAGAASQQVCQRQRQQQQQQQQQQQHGEEQPLGHAAQGAGAAASEVQQRQQSPGDPLGAAAGAADLDAAVSVTGSDSSKADAAAGEDSSRTAEAKPGRTPEDDARKLVDGAAAAGAPAAAGEQRPGVESSSVTSSQAPAAAVVPSHELPDGWPASPVVFVCGVQPDWRTPLAWLHANMKAADCFLYIVVHLVQ
ncbi:autophagy protein Apg5-domain-containing protein [Scenedesmus sp. NREL 46B-D3]|nr:autophagy protein Apg5-domain-containing protein [Scenedesmus sp. NREL 46B-D3]